MDHFFDAKFYEDAISVFSCPFQRTGSDSHKLSQSRLGAARSCTSSIPSENKSKKGCLGFRTHVDPATERPVNTVPLHYTAQFSYVPTPLHGWTEEQQLSLIAATKTVPSERSLMIERCGWTEKIARHKYLLLISEQVPSKSAQECERCLKHLEVKRVAYFGQHHHRG
jgi:hypothetical protein